MIRDRRGVVRAGSRATLAAVSALGLVALGALPAQASSNPVFDAEWALSSSVFNITQIWSQYGARGAGVTVAVVDTGVDPNQLDLQNSLVPGVDLLNPSSPTSNINDVSADYHGTDVASIIAAHGHGSPSDLQGMIGLAPQAKILPVKTTNKAQLSGNATAQGAALLAGIEYAADHGAKVINVSFGDQAPTVSMCDQLTAQAIDYALAKGVVVVVAAGNSAQQGNPVNCLGAPGAVVVGAVQQNGQVAAFSEYNSTVDVAAPGVNIEEPAANGQFKMGDGTSFAAPWVSAEAALIIGMHPTWTPGQVVRDIIDNTVQGTGHRINDHIGYGVIDPLAALGAAAPAQTSNPLGGPAVGASVAPVAGIGYTPSVAGGSNPPSTAPTAATTTAVAAPKSSSTGSSAILLYAAIGAGVLVLIGLIVFLIGRGKNNGPQGGGGGGGGGGGSSGWPPPGPGGQYAQPPHIQPQLQPQPQPVRYPGSGSGSGVGSAYGGQPAAGQPGQPQQFPYYQQPGQ